MCNALLSYGMPSAVSRLATISKLAEMGDGNSGEEVKFPDFIICSRIIYLCKLSNQLITVILSLSYYKIE